MLMAKFLNRLVSVENDIQVRERINGEKKKKNQLKLPTANIGPLLSFACHLPARSLTLPRNSAMGFFNRQLPVFPTLADIPEVFALQHGPDTLKDLTPGVEGNTVNLEFTA